MIVSKVEKRIEYTRQQNQQAMRGVGGGERKIRIMYITFNIVRQLLISLVKVKLPVKLTELF